MGPRHLFLMIASCLVLGCQTQPHHTPADPELIAEVRLALDAVIADLQVEPPPSERELNQQATILTNLARNAIPAWEALHDGRLGDQRLRDLAEDMIQRMPEIPDVQREPPVILDQLLNSPRPWNPAQRILILGLTHRLVDQGPVQLSETEMRFFGRAPAQAAPR